MARTVSWLAAERTAMIGIFKEMERNSSYTRDGATRGDLSLMLARLSQEAAGKDGRARSLSAMRQAWWRWTTDGPNASTPPVHEMALMVRYAKNNGWLRDLSRPDCLSLVKRLMNELNKHRVVGQRTREVAWAPTVRIAVESFIDFLETRIVERAEGDYKSVVIPSALIIQQEVSALFTELTERVLVGLNTPREIFKEPHETDTYLQPLEGWPETFRRLASDMSEILNSAAKEYEEIEASLFPPPSDSGSTLRRKNLLHRSPRNAEPH
ncbi:hypothetical protein [Agrobacterium sp.]|uniref:hypothetical protein n=1 Tax=Agrobacterium sp. TaxID=361 RepID=UPI0040336096